MAEFELSTHLAADPDAVWAALQHPATMEYVSRPMITFDPLDPPGFPARWRPGDYRVALRLFGLPIGQQVLRLSTPPAQGFVRFLRDNGGGGLATVWDHRIRIEPDDFGTRYTDILRVEAGWRTPVVAAFAKAFYRHRQRRWRRLAARGLELP